MIKINNLSFSYGEKKIFENFSLLIGDGDRVCIFGNSGCGKTTLLRLLMGLEMPQSGEISVTENKKISAVFQENRLLPFLSVIDNIKTVGGNTEKGKEILDNLGIGNYSDKLPKDLSGGMKRRAAIARALCCEYDILILDEPFNGLDEYNIETAARVIDKECKDKIIILVTHSEKQAELLKCNIVKI